MTRQVRRLEERALEGGSDSSRVTFGALRNCKDLAERHRACVSGDDLVARSSRPSSARPSWGHRERLAWAFGRVGNEQAPSQGEQRSGAFGRCCRRAEAPRCHELGLVTVRASGNQLGALADDLDPA